MQNLLGTVRYTLRQFRQLPVFTSAAVLTLALLAALVGAGWALWRQTRFG